ncbi:hypothetical protein AVEN_99415-1, partial [Araneus ventricosus]
VPCPNLTTLHSVSIINDFLGYRSSNYDSLNSELSGIYCHSTENERLKRNRSVASRKFCHFAEDKMIAGPASWGVYYKQEHFIRDTLGQKIKVMIWWSNSAELIGCHLGKTVLLLLGICKK